MRNQKPLGNDNVPQVMPQGSEAIASNYQTKPQARPDEPIMKFISKSANNKFTIRFIEQGTVKPYHLPSFFNNKGKP